MNPPELTAQVISFLVPMLPYLIKVGEKATEEVGKKIGSDAWDKAKLLWSKLKPELKEKPTATRAIRELANDPNDDYAKSAFSSVLSELFKENKTLASEIDLIISDEINVNKTNIYQRAGNNSILIGQADKVDIKK